MPSGGDTSNGLGPLKVAWAKSGQPKLCRQVDFAKLYCLRLTDRRYRTLIGLGSRSVPECRRILVQKPGACNVEDYEIHSLWPSLRPCFFTWHRFFLRLLIGTSI